MLSRDELNVRYSCGLDPILTSNLEDASYNVLAHGWDWLHLNSGMERGGKSSFALEQCMFLSKRGLKFDWSEALSHVFFFEPHLAKKMMLLPPSSVIMLDEGGEMLMSRRALEHEVVNIVQTLMVYGARNTFLIINIPNWRWIDKYIRQSRVRSLCDVYTFARPVRVGGATRFVRARGFYGFYSRRKVLKASQTEYKHLGKPSFRGRFQSFASLFPREWSFYMARKMGFLREKAKRKTSSAKELRELRARRLREKLSVAQRVTRLAEENAAGEVTQAK